MSVNENQLKQVCKHKLGTMKSKLASAKTLRIPKGCSASSFLAACKVAAASFNRLLPSSVFMICRYSVASSAFVLGPCSLRLVMKAFHVDVLGGFLLIVAGFRTLFLKLLSAGAAVHTRRSLISRLALLVAFPKTYRSMWSFKRLCCILARVTYVSLCTMGGMRPAFCFTRCFTCMFACSLSTRSDVTGAVKRVSRKATRIALAATTVRWWET